MAAAFTGTPLLSQWAPARAVDAWPPGGALYHCHQHILDQAGGQYRYRAGEFNPTGAPRHRFSPLCDSDGRVIPTWYGASSPEGAVCESILHDIPVGVDGFVPAAKVRHRRVSAVQPARPLRLVRLDSDGLHSLKLSPKDSTDTEAADYPRTVTVAMRLHDTTPADGIAWVSKRRNIDCAVVLFGDRVTEADLSATGLVHDFDTTNGFAWLYDFATTLGIAIAPPA